MLATLLIHVDIVLALRRRASLMLGMLTVLA